MHNNQKETDYAALLKRSLLEMERLEKRVQQLEYQKREPIAIVGIGARFPGGGEGVEAFWDALKTATNAIREVPANRWDNDAYYDPDPNAAGKIYTTGGSFLDDVDQFDAAFFGISPREAKEMDPQQRLLLEVCWEALETASYAPNSLSGSATGVYMGIMNQDYSRLSDDFRHINMHSGTGNAISVVAGRLSDFFGFRGPTITLDTACSSSLVAVHLACQSLRSGECERALAGGVNLMLSPMANIVECRAHMLSPKGHCHTFDSAADGFARGEGCGVVVLKRLSDALRDRDHIWAVIRGNAVNHDGASGGLTVPNSNAQRALIRQALQMAGVQPTEVAYVEAHGTGTPLGDPIEMTALVAEYGADRTMEQPLLIGSVKSNFGHLEGAAGIVGLAKALLCLYHGKIPANLHFYNPNPHIAWDKIPVAIPTEYRDWPEGKDKRRAAVSSFGFSGTNAHMVLEEAPHLSSDGRKRHTEGEALLLTLSAKSPEALGQVCERFAHYFTQHQLTALQAADVCYAANIGRVDFPHRMAFVAENPASLQKQLSGGDAAEQSQEKKAGVLAKTVFVCPDFSREDCFLGAALYQSEPDFSAAFDRCVELLNRLEEGPWVERLLSLTDQKSQSESALYVLPLSFASKFALASLWMNWGIRPAAVMGCGTGLYVAACLSGTLALEDGLRLALAHARHLEKGENLVDDFPQVAADMSYGKAKLKWLDARTGTTVQMEELGEAYWRSAVTVNELPQHILTGLEKEHQLVISLDCPDSHKMMHNLAEWYALVDIDWKAFYRHAHNRAMPLPTYPFERKSYWLDLPKQEEKQLQKNFQNGVQKIGKQTLSDSSDRQPFCEWTWQAFDKKQTKPSAQSSDGPILLFMDERGVGEQLVAAFGKQKVAYTLIYKGRESSSQDQRKNGIDCHHWKGDDQKELHHLLSTKVNISDYHRIIYLWGVDAQETTSIQATQSAFLLLKTVMSLSLHPNVRLWFCTQGAQVLSGDEQPIPAASWQAPLWGLGRGMSTEFPNIPVSLMDMEGGTNQTIIDNDILPLLLREERENQFAIRSVGAFVPRLKELTAIASDVPLSISSEGSHLITGGNGGLGRRLAEWLSHKGASQLILMGRSIPEAKEFEQWKSRLSPSTKVYFQQADVSDAEDMKRFFETTVTQFPPLKGIYHLAGVLNDQLLKDQSWEAVSSILDAKTKGSWHLHQWSQSLTLDQFVLFSSTAAWITLPGQAAYSGANAFLDSLSRHRQQHGLPATNINWGPWADIGFAASAEGAKSIRALQQLGIQSLTAQRAMEWMEMGLTAGWNQFGIIEVDWQVFAQSPLLQAHAPILSLLAKAEQKESEIYQEWKSLAAAEKVTFLADYIEQSVRQTLKWRRDAALDRTSSLLDLGMDSLMAMEMMNAVRKDFAIDIPIKALIDGSSIEKLSQFLSLELARKQAMQLAFASSEPEEEMDEMVI